MVDLSGPTTMESAGLVHSKCQRSKNAQPIERIPLITPHCNQKLPKGSLPIHPTTLPMEYTALASTSTDDGDNSEPDDDWHMLNETKDHEMMPADHSSKQQESSTSPQDIASTETKTSNTVDNSQHSTSETKPDATNDDPSPEGEQAPVEGWNAYLRKGAVAAVGGTMVGVGLVMVRCTFHACQHCSH